MKVIVNILCLCLAWVFVSNTHAETSKYVQLIAQADFQLPTNVIASIKASPLSFGENIVARTDYQSNIIRTKYLTISKRASMVFKLNPRITPPPFIVVAAENVFIEGPQIDSDVATITYELTGTTDGLFPGNGKDGTNMQPVGNGTRGGNGEKGPDGANGITYNLPPIYILFHSISVRGGNPNSSQLLAVSFNGVAGGNGSNGGNGGRGGDGGRGKNAECNRICVPILGCTGFECRAGSGDGGDSGTPGLGGPGGDGAVGGNGADIHYFGPKDSIALMGFFAPINFGSSPGKKGEGGFCGNVGQEGGGGGRECCPSDAKHGNKTPCPGPDRGQSGQDSKTPGVRGGFSITERSLTDLF